MIQYIRGHQNAWGDHAQNIPVRIISNRFQVEQYWNIVFASSMSESRPQCGDSTKLASCWSQGLWKHNIKWSNDQRVYLKNDNSKNQDFLMYFGLAIEGGNPELNFDDERWNAMKKYEQHQASKDGNVEEILWRSKLYLLLKIESTSNTSLQTGALQSEVWKSNVFKITPTRCLIYWRIRHNIKQHNFECPAQSAGQWSMQSW